MEIDKEINRSLAITLLKSREAVMNRFRPMLASAKITEQQWRVLRGLSENGEVEAGKLAIIACILPQSLSRISRNFEKQNLIFMKRDPNDARKILMSLTNEGETLMSKALIESKEIYSNLIDDFGKENLDTLLKSLNLLQISLNPQNNNT